MRNRLKRLLTPVVNHLLTEKLPASAAPHDPRPAVYRRILETRPVPMPAQSDLELHMLVSERDFLRSIWALKSFFHYSDLPARLVIQSDGSLTPASLDHFREHFPGCVIHADHDHFDEFGKLFFDGTQDLVFKRLIIGLGFLAHAYSWWFERYRYLDSERSAIALFDFGLST